MVSDTVVFSPAADDLEVWEEALLLELVPEEA